METEYLVITLSLTCMGISLKELGNLTMVSASEMWVTEEKKTDKDDSELGFSHL